MYSRYHDRPERPIQVPENYSGCAFSDRRSSADDLSSYSAPRRIDVAKPTPPPEPNPSQGMPPPPRTILLPPPKEQTRREPPCEEKTPTQAPPPCAERSKEETAHREDHRERSAAFLQPFQGLFGNVGPAFPFSHGLGFDELLIIGLIILLSHSGQDSDLILWLALLLFCG